ncbi:MAG: ATP-binding protein, partial [bacterium]|nr:ATP-binding protein [bacterium]
KPAGKGTGLGLAVCYGIVTAHNGRIDVSATPTGTIFTVAIPLG